MQCDVHVVLFAYPISRISRQRKRLQKFYQRSRIVILSDLCNAIKKILDNISCQGTSRFHCKKI